MIWPTQIHYLYFARLLWSENLYLLYRKSKYIFDVDHFIGYLKHDVYIVQDILRREDRDPLSVSISLTGSYNHTEK
jgi:hypothetical protein